MWKLKFNTDKQCTVQIRKTERAYKTQEEVRRILSELQVKAKHKQKKEEDEILILVKNQNFWKTIF